MQDAPWIMYPEEYSDAFYQVTDEPYDDADDDDEPVEYLTDEPGFTRDYGPSNPWDAPGMRISDFI